MSDKLPSRSDVADFERRARSAVEAELRSEDPEITDDEVAANLDRAGPAHIVAARVRDDRDPVRRTGSLQVSAGHYRGTPESLRELRRDVLGGPGGAPSGTGMQYADVVAFVRDFAGDPTQDNVAGDVRMPGVRTLSRIARPYGGWRALLRDAGRD